MSALKPAVVVFVACDLVLGGAILWFVDRPAYIALVASLHRAFGAK